MSAFWIRVMSLETTPFRLEEFECALTLLGYDTMTVTRACEMLQITDPVQRGDFEHLLGQAPSDPVERGAWHRRIVITSLGARLGLEMLDSVTNVLAALGLETPPSMA